jgi:secondary thiamine-phosphate synthase enzyme
MAVFSGELSFEMSAGVDVVDITGDVMDLVSSSGISDGIVCVFVSGSTAAVTTIEYEAGLVRDMENTLEKLIPSNLEYEHNKRWHDGNGHSHVRASLIGQSVAFPLTDGALPLGTWQQIVCLNLDTRPRSRKVTVQVCGE